MVGREVIDFVRADFRKQIIQVRPLADIEHRKADKALGLAARRMVDTVNAVALPIEKSAEQAAVLTTRSDD
jgi:hypothetical protein